MDNFLKNICILNFGLTLYLSYRLCKIENKLNKNLKNKNKIDIKKSKKKKLKNNSEKIIEEVVKDVVDKIVDIEECNKVICKKKMNCINKSECNKCGDFKTYEKLDSVIPENKINSISSSPELLENPITPLNKDSIIRKHSDELCQTLFDFNKYCSWRNKFS